MPPPLPPRPRAGNLSKRRRRQVAPRKATRHPITVSRLPCERKKNNEKKSGREIDPSSSMPVCFLDAHATTMMTPLFLSFSLSHCPFSCLPEFPLIAPYGAVNSVAFDCNIVCVPVSPTPISFSRRCRAFTLTAGEISRMHTARVTSLPPCLAHPPLIITVTSRTCRPVAELGFLGHDI